MKNIQPYTPELHRELLSVARKFTQENIDSIFIMEPVWKRLFLSKFPNYTPESYLENAWSILLDNGFRYTVERMTSEKLKCVVNLDLYRGEVEDDDFIVGTERLHEWSGLIHLLNYAIDEDEEVLSKLK